MITSKKSQRYFQSPSFESDCPFRSFSQIQRNLLQHQGTLSVSIKKTYVHHRPCPPARTRRERNRCSHTLSGKDRKAEIIDVEEDGLSTQAPSSGSLETIIPHFGFRLPPVYSPFPESESWDGSLPRSGEWG